MQWPMLDPEMLRRNGYIKKCVCVCINNSKQLIMKEQIQQGKGIKQWFLVYPVLVPSYLVWVPLFGTEYSSLGLTMVLMSPSQS